MLQWEEAGWLSPGSQAENYAKNLNGETRPADFGASPPAPHPYSHQGY